MEENLENKKVRFLIAITFFFMWALLVKFAGFHIMHSAVSFVLIYGGVFEKDKILKVAYIVVSVYVLINELIRVVSL